MTSNELEIARQALAAAQQQAHAADQQVVIAQHQLEIAYRQMVWTIVLALTPVAISLWQLYLAMRLGFSTSYDLRGEGGGDSSVTINNDNDRSVYVAHWETLWKTPQRFGFWRSQVVDRADPYDGLGGFDIPAFGRKTMGLYELGGPMAWPHPDRQARFYVRIWISGRPRPWTLLVMDQARD